MNFKPSSELVNLEKEIDIKSKELRDLKERVEELKKRPLLAETADGEYVGIGSIVYFYDMDGGYPETLKIKKSTIASIDKQFNRSNSQSDICVNYRCSYDESPTLRSGKLDEHWHMPTGVVFNSFEKCKQAGLHSCKIWETQARGELDCCLIAIENLTLTIEEAVESLEIITKEENGNR